MLAGIITLAMAAALESPVSAAGTHAAEFLRFPVGRPAARSGAGAAADRGVTAVYWNPAGLPGGPQVYAAHDSLPETMSYDFLAVALPLGGSGTLAYGLQALSQGDLARRDNTGRDVGSFSAFDQAHTVAWGSAAGPLRLGAAGRFIRQSVEDVSGSAFGMDFGAQYDRGPWNFGVGVSNLGSTLQLANEQSELPLTYRAGAALHLAQDRAMLALDTSMLDGEEPLVHLGATVRPLPVVGISFGYAFKNNRDSDEPSGLAAGIGLDLGAFTADFAFSPFGAFGNAVQVGAGYRFGGGAKPQARAERKIGPGAPLPAAAAAPAVPAAVSTSAVPSAALAASTAAVPLLSPSTAAAAAVPADIVVASTAASPVLAGPVAVSTSVVPPTAVAASTAVPLLSPSTATVVAPSTVAVMSAASVAASTAPAPGVSPTPQQGSAPVASPVPSPGPASPAPTAVPSAAPVPVQGADGSAPSSAPSSPRQGAAPDQPAPSPAGQPG